MASSTVESAFENSKGYELTGLGQQFVHYAMTDLPLKLTFQQKGSDEQSSGKRDQSVEVVYPSGDGRLPVPNKIAMLRS